MRRLLTATVLLLGTSVAAHATILAGGPIFGGVTQTIAECWVFNAGSTAINITSSRIIRDDGVSIPLFFNSCGTLGAEDTCGIAGLINSSQLHSYTIVFPESKTNVRGSLEIRQGAPIVLINTPLR
jgi:hypothetical protein